MELRDYLRVLRKSWTLILALTVVGVALGVGLTLATTKVYQATVQIYVSSNSESNNTNSSSNFLLSRVQTYSSFATAPLVLNRVLTDPNVLAAYGVSASPSPSPSGSGTSSTSGSTSRSASTSPATSSPAAGSSSATSGASSPAGSSSPAASSPAASSPAASSPVASASSSPNAKVLPGVPSLEQLKSQVTADVPKSQALINLHVTDTDPIRATVIANALGKAFVAVVPNTEQKIVVTDSLGNSKQVAAVKLTVIQPATIPGKPIKPNKTLNIGLGIVLGLLIGIGVAVVREVLDNTVKGAEDFESLGIPLLAQIAYDKRTSRSVIAFRADAHSARSESYRQLRTNLQFVDVDHPPKIIAVTSAVPGEGKSTTAINLAAALAEAGSRVCLIEADLRRPSIARALGLVTDVGFTTVVIGKAPIETVLQNAGRNLAVLTSGPIPPNPSELLVSQHARQVIYDIAEKVDFVVIDTPPLLPVTDGAEIATIADATLLVHRASKTTKDQANRSLQALAKVGRRPVGVVLNMVSRARGGEYSYEYGYYYSAYRPDKKGKGNGPGKSRTEVMSAADLAGTTTSSPDEAVLTSADASASNPSPGAGAVAVETAVATVSTATTTDADTTDENTAAGRQARHHRDDETASAPRGRFGRKNRTKRGGTATAAESPVTTEHAVAEPVADSRPTDAVREPDPDTTKTVTLPPITVNGRSHQGDPDAGHAASDALADDAVPAEVDAPADELTPAAGTSEVPGSHAGGAPAPSGDEFADDYPPFSAAEDEFTPVPPGNLDDVTIHLEGQDELPLEQRQPLVEFDEDALDEALGVKSTDKRS